MFLKKEEIKENFNEIFENRVNNVYNIIYYIIVSFFSVRILIFYCFLKIFDFFLEFIFLIWTIFVDLPVSIFFNIFYILKNFYYSVYFYIDELQIEVFFYKNIKKIIIFNLVILLLAFLSILFYYYYTVIGNYKMYQIFYNKFDFLYTYTKPRTLNKIIFKPIAFLYDFNDPNLHVFSGPRYWVDQRVGFKTIITVNPLFLYNPFITEADIEPVLGFSEPLKFNDLKYHFINLYQFSFSYAIILFIFILLLICVLFVIVIIYNTKIKWYGYFIFIIFFIFIYKYWYQDSYYNNYFYFTFHFIIFSPLRILMGLMDLLESSLDPYTGFFRTEGKYRVSCWWRKNPINLVHSFGFISIYDIIDFIISEYKTYINPVKDISLEINNEPNFYGKIIYKIHQFMFQGTRFANNTKDNSLNHSKLEEDVDPTGKFDEPLEDNWNFLFFIQFIQDVIVAIWWPGNK